MFKKLFLILVLIGPIHSALASNFETIAVAKDCDDVDPGTEDHFE